MKHFFSGTFLRYLVLSSLSLAAAALLRHGLTFESGDQITHSLWGIRMADPAAFLNDWTVDSMVMPHWSFDWVTYFGEKHGILELVYQIYWGCGVMALAAGLMLLNARINPGYPCIAILAGPVLVLGPVSLAGSTTPILGEAIPHYLGGSFAILGLGLLAHRYMLWALVAGALAVLVHVQHGFNFALILLLSGIFLRGRERLIAIGGAGAMILTVLLIACRPGLLGNFQELQRVCQYYIPFHCYAPSWGSGKIGYPLVYFVFSSLLLWSLFRRDFILALVALVPAVGVLISITLDHFSVPLLAELVRGSNSYRLITLFYPIAVLAIFRGIFSRTLLFSLLGLSFLGIWLTGPSAMYQFSSGRALEAGLLLVLATRWAGSGVIGHFLLAAAAASTAAFYFDPPGLGADPTMKQIGEQVRQQVPAGDIIIAAPTLVALRLASRRAVIAEWKTHPFGGDALQEWAIRMQDLGGYDLSPESFRRLPFERLEQLSSKYKARFVILDKLDPKLVEAKRLWGEGAVLPGGDLTLFLMSAPSTQVEASFAGK